MAKARNSKSNPTKPAYPREDIPFLFFDESSVVNANRDIARFYLYRNRPSLDDKVGDPRPEVVAELGMGLGAFAIMTLDFYGTLKQMMDRRIFDPEISKALKEGIAEIEGQKGSTAVSRARKGQSKP